MGRSRCLAFTSLLVLVPCLFFFSSATAAPLQADVGGRRSLLQAVPPTPQATPPTPRATPPTPRATPPTPAATPPTPRATPPTPAATPPTPRATPPTTPPSSTTPTPPTATPPVPAGALPPVPNVAPGPAPFIAPAPAPIGVTSRQKTNAAIAGGVIGSVIFIAIVLIFCRCNCIRRSKKMPFQRLQMT